MAFGDGDGSGGQHRRLEQLATSHILTAVSRVITVGGWVLVFCMTAFFAPKLWDFGVTLQRQQNEQADSLKDLGHALDRVTWRLKTNGDHDERQDRHMEFQDRRMDQIERGQSSRPPFMPPGDDDAPGGAR